MQGFETKPSADAARDDGSQRAFSFLKELKHAHTLTAFRGSFHTESLRCYLLFAYSSKK
jgi:hypothetical protein